jgi:hypothetical protein
MDKVQKLSNNYLHGKWNGISSCFSNGDNVKFIRISLFIFLFSCNKGNETLHIYKKQQAIFKKKILTTYMCIL